MANDISGKLPIIYVRGFAGGKALANHANSLDRKCFRASVVRSLGGSAGTQCVVAALHLAHLALLPARAVGHAVGPPPSPRCALPTLPDGRR